MKAEELPDIIVGGWYMISISRKTEMADAGREFPVCSFWAGRLPEFSGHYFNLREKLMLRFSIDTDLLATCRTMTNEEVAAWRKKTEEKTKAEALACIEAEFVLLVDTDF